MYDLNPEEIIAKVEELNKKNLSLIEKYSRKFSMFDVRADFFNLLAGELIHFSIGFETFILAQCDIKFEQKEEEELFKDSSLFSKLTLNQKKKKVEQKALDMNAYIAKLRNNFIFAVWSEFETSIDQIYEEIIDKKEKDNIKRSKYNEVCKILIGYSIKKNDLEKLEKTLNINHVALPNRYNSLINLIDRKKYNLQRNIKQDRALLDLFNDLRNATHNNTISRKDATYKTPIGKYTLEKGKLIKFVSNKFLIEITNELIDITDYIFEKINHPNEIKINKEYLVE